LDLAAWTFGGHGLGNRRVSGLQITHHYCPV
jgi:hypothetical protein